MDERITEHFRLLHKYLEYLKEFVKLNEEEFLNSFAIRGVSERYLQLAIESCLNIGSRILALQQTNTELAAPENYADIFVKLGKLGAFSEEQVIKFVEMAKFRNKLVHGYWEIDPKIVFRILKENIDDFYEFKEGIINYLKEQKIENN